MIQSLLVYTGTALGMFALARNAANREKYLLRTEKRPLSFFCLEIILLLLLFAFISGVRYNVGVDHLSYLDEYQSLQKYGAAERKTFEPGFLVISELFANGGAHFSIYFGFWALVQVFFLYYAFRNKKELMPYLGLVLMLGSYYLNFMNGMRQSVVALAFILLMEWIQLKKMYLYFGAVLLLSTIHRSAFILLPVYFLFHSSFDISNRKVNFAVLFICILLGETPSWLSIMNSFKGLLLAIGYEGYSDKIELMTTENLRDTAWGPGRLAIFGAGCFILYHYEHLKNFFKDDVYVKMYFILFFIGMCWYNLFANTSHIFLRVGRLFFYLPIAVVCLFIVLFNERR